MGNGNVPQKPSKKMAMKAHQGFTESASVSGRVGKQRKWTMQGLLKLQAPKASGDLLSLSLFFWSFSTRLLLDIPAFAGLWAMGPQLLNSN